MPSGSPGPDQVSVSTMDCELSEGDQVSDPESVNLPVTQVDCCAYAFCTWIIRWAKKKRGVRKKSLMTFACFSAKNSRTLFNMHTKVWSFVNLAVYLTNFYGLRFAAPQ